MILTRLGNKRKMKETIHLNLKRKWFDMILTGEKTEEYREIKPYYDKRLYHLFPQMIRNEVYQPIIETITFSNGYSKDRFQMVVELNGIEKDFGKTYWGAEKGKRYYVLKLGKILQVGRQGFLFTINKNTTVDLITDVLQFYKPN